MSITKRLIILFLCVSLIPLIIISIVSYSTIENEITKKTQEDLSTTADRQLEKINVVLQTNAAETKELASNFDLRITLSAYLLKRNPQSVSLLKEILQEYVARSPFMTEAFLMDANGSIIASVPTQAELGNTLQTFIGRKATTIIILRDEVTNSAKLYFSYPIMLEGSQVGVLLTVFNPDRINGILQDYTGLGNSGQTILAEKDIQGNARAIAPVRFDKNAAFKRTFNNIPLFKGENKLYTNLVDYRGNEILAVTRFIPDANWGMAVMVSTNEVFAPIKTLRDILIILFLTASIIVSVLAFFFARSFTTPIIKLTKKTERIALGDLNQIIDITSSDEIGKLATSFNSMTSKLQALYSGLEQKVKEKTAELSGKVNDLENAKMATLNLLEDIQQEKKRAEEERARDEALLASIGDGMVATDKTGRIVMANKSAEDMMQWTKQEFIGKNINEIVSVKQTGGDKSGISSDNPLMRVLTTGQKMISAAIGNDTVHLTRKDKTQFPVVMTATPVKVNDQLVGSILIFRDATKEREVDRMKTEFISLASHQLRTPLSAIKWFTEMLLGGDAGPLSPEQKDFAKNVSDSAERMIQLVNSLLNISRIESGRIMINPQPTDLRLLVQGIVNDLQAKIHERNQNLIISVREDLPQINIDPRLIGQVYMNLLTNAIKYTPKGGEITVFISRKGDEIISQVSDNGYGIPVAQQGKIFQKFFRAENIVKVETDGTGLGLYLIKSIIESSKGKIWFKSEEGKGTTFWFSLPMSGMVAKKGEVTIE